MFGDDAPSPRAVVGRILGAATVVAAGGLLAVLVTTGRIEWKFVTLVGILWGAYSFIGGLFAQVLEPGARFLADQLTGNVASPEPNESIDELTERLERLLEHGATGHREILVGIRLAEIYRTHQHDQAKSDALLARLCAKYPDAPELDHARAG